MKRVEGYVGVCSKKNVAQGANVAEYSRHWLGIVLHDGATIHDQNILEE